MTTKLRKGQDPRDKTLTSNPFHASFIQDIKAKMKQSLYVKSTKLDLADNINRQISKLNNQGLEAIPEDPLGDTITTAKMGQSSKPTEQDDDEVVMEFDDIENNQDLDIRESIPVREQSDLFDKAPDFEHQNLSPITYTVIENVDENTKE